MATTSDGKVVLPDHIKSQVEAGERIMAAQKEPPPPAIPPTPAPPPAPPPASPPPSELDPDPPPMAAEPPPPPSEVDQLRHTIRSLNGRHQAEKARLEAEMARRDRELAELRTQVTNLTTKLVSSPPEKNPLTTQEPSATLTAEEIRDFGPELAGFIDRRARQLVTALLAEHIAPLQEQVRTVEGSVNTIDTRHRSTVDQRFAAFMDSYFADSLDWRKQDDDPLFLEWLRQEDAYSGLPREDLLRAAGGKEDFKRVALIFEGYARETGAINPRSAIGQPRGARRTSLERLAAPGSGARGRTEAITTPAAPEAPPTQADIAAFYKAMANPRGHKMSEAEIANMERRIMDAARNNSIPVQHRI